MVVRFCISMWMKQVCPTLHDQPQAVQGLRSPSRAPCQNPACRQARYFYVLRCYCFKYTGIQPAVPHFLVSNGTRLSSKVVKAFKCLPKTQLQVLRRKSAWVTSDLMIAILQEVAKALEPFLHQFRPVLLLDGVPAHVSKAVMRAARKLNISLIYIYIYIYSMWSN